MTRLDTEMLTQWGASKGVEPNHHHDIRGFFKGFVSLSSLPHATQRTLPSQNLEGDPLDFTSRALQFPQRGECEWEGATRRTRTRTDIFF